MALVAYKKQLKSLFHYSSVQVSHLSSTFTLHAIVPPARPLLPALRWICVLLKSTQTFEPSIYHLDTCWP
jgi:hypothetical protein